MKKKEIFKFHNSKQYEIVWDKIKTVDDIKVVLKTLDITLWLDEELFKNQFKEIKEKGFVKIKT